MSAPAPARDIDFVQSLARGLAVIRAFGPGRDRLSLSDVARATGLDKSVTRRLLVTLRRLGYVRSDGRKFSLQPRVLELGYGYMSELSLAALATPHLQQLTARLNESSSVAVLDGHHIVYVARVPARRIMTETVSVGTRLPAYATSIGRVLLAALPSQELERYLTHARMEPLTCHTVTEPSLLRAELARVATQGYAVIDQELEQGLRAVAAPVRGASAGLASAAPADVAAVSVSADASRVSLVTLRDRFLPALLETAARIEADLTTQRRPRGRDAARSGSDQP